MFHPKVHEGHTVHSGIGGISLDIQTYQIYKVKFTKKERPQNTATREKFLSFTLILFNSFQRKKLLVKKLI